MLVQLARSSARRVQRTKSRGLKGHQLKARARAPKFLVIIIIIIIVIVIIINYDIIMT